MTISEDAIKVIREVAEKLLDTVSRFEDLATCIRGLSDQYADVLGQNKSALDSAITSIEEAAQSAREPAANLASQLRGIYESYMEIYNTAIWK